MADATARTKYFVEKTFGVQASAEIEARLSSNDVVSQITKRELANLMAQKGPYTTVADALAGTGGAVTEANAILALAMALGSFEAAKDVAAKA